jgi:hypothetical protein
MFAHTRPARRLRRGPVGLVAVAGLAAAVALAGAATKTPPGVEGQDTRVPDSRRPKLTATFPRESYRPGAHARLLLFSRARHVVLRFFRAGFEPRAARANDLMLGAPVGEPVSLGPVRPGQAKRVKIGNWPTGCYVARLTTPGGRIGFAPFVLRPRRLGENRAAVVLPTQTWQAYNFRDDDGDGDEDSWYVSGDTARLGRPFLNRGVPYHYKSYDAAFLRWLARMNHRADFLSDADLNGIPSGRFLARRYSLIVFPGHHEYVTQREYDVISDFRNRGGNLAFLSANNFFYKVRRDRNVMKRLSRWRDIGRPEAALIGVQHFGFESESRGPWIVRRRIPWLFAGTRLRKGSRFGSGGIEADRIYPSSPRQVQVVAEIPNLFGRGKTAQMTYYERGGAKVFAAGAFTLAGSSVRWDVGQLLNNLWSRLVSDTDTGA